MTMQTHSAAQDKYLTFSLGEEKYGLDILKVREINGMMNITPIPEAPVFLKGVINLRGKIIPVVDLRLKFDMDEHPYNERTCIIVVQTNKKGAPVPMGLIVDSVSDVASITDEDIEPPPAMGLTIETSYITGMAKGKEDIKILLDIDRVLSDKELNEIYYG